MRTNSIANRLSSRQARSKTFRVLPLIITSRSLTVLQNSNPCTASSFPTRCRTWRRNPSLARLASCWPPMGFDLKPRRQSTSSSKPCRRKSVPPSITQTLALTSRSSRLAVLAAPALLTASHKSLTSPAVARSAGSITTKSPASYRTPKAAHTTPMSVLPRTLTSSIDLKASTSTSC